MEFSGMKLLAQGLVLMVPDPLHVLTIWSARKQKTPKDEEIWQCRKVHTVVKGNLTYSMKDVKLTVRHESWLVDSKLPLESIVELMYLWSQSFSVDEIIHELKLSKKNSPIRG